MLILSGISICCAVILLVCFLCFKGSLNSSMGVTTVVVTTLAVALVVLIVLRYIDEGSIEADYSNFKEEKEACMLILEDDDLTTAEELAVYSRIEEADTKLKDLKLQADSALFVPDSVIKDIKDETYISDDIQESGEESESLTTEETSHIERADE